MKLYFTTVRLNSDSNDRPQLYHTITAGKTEQDAKDSIQPPEQVYYARECTFDEYRSVFDKSTIINHRISEEIQDLCKKKLKFNG